MEKWELEFYRMFTDEADRYNKFYDSQFTEGRPHLVVDFINDLLNKKYEQGFDEGYSEAEKEAALAASYDYEI